MSITLPNFPDLEYNYPEGILVCTDSSVHKFSNDITSLISNSVSTQKWVIKNNC